MIQIVINRCPQGSLLSDAGKAELAKRHGGTMPDPVDRTDPLLVAMMQENAVLYGGKCAQIHIVEVPDGFAWKLKTKGNVEWVAADA